ncbi:MAG: hypothetical protein ABR598_03895 [Candidatus Dormibacteria bacterium]
MPDTDTDTSTDTSTDTDTDTDAGGGQDRAKANQDRGSAADAERRRANRLEAENRKMAQRLKEIDDLKLTETERLTKEKADLERQKEEFERERVQTRVRNAIESGARKADFADPEDAHRFIDLEDVEYDKEGQPKNIKKLLDELLEKRPYLAGAAAGGGTSHPGTRQTSQSAAPDLMDRFIRGGR